MMGQPPVKKSFHVRRHDGEVKAEEVVVYVEQSVELAGKLRKIIGDELGKADLFIAHAHALGVVAEGGGQGGDLRHDVLGEQQKRLERLADDGIECDEVRKGRKLHRRPLMGFTPSLRVEEAASPHSCAGDCWRISSGFSFILGWKRFMRIMLFFRLHLEGQRDELHDEREEHQCPAVGSRSAHRRCAGSQAKERKCNSRSLTFFGFLRGFKFGHGTGS